MHVTTLLLFIALSPAALAERLPVQAMPVSVNAPAWAAAQVIGPPDAGAGDDPKAWATMAADAGREWLEVRFERSTLIDRVVIFENEAPGAIARVVALDAEHGEVVLWEGTAPPQKAPARFEVKAKREARAARIRIELDTSRVAGWNEIDAVQLVGADGTRQWAIGATASSSYADADVAASPFADLVGRPVRVHLDGAEVLEGRLVSADGTFLRLEGRAGVYVVSQAAVRYVAGAL